MNTNTSFHFEVGKVYWENNPWFKDFKVIKKTNCFIWITWLTETEIGKIVKGDPFVFQKRIKTDCEGNEYVLMDRKDTGYHSSNFNIWSYHQLVNGERRKLELE